MGNIVYVLKFMEVAQFKKRIECDIIINNEGRALNLNYFCK